MDPTINGVIEMGFTIRAGTSENMMQLMQFNSRTNNVVEIVAILKHRNVLFIVVNWRNR